MAEAGLIRRRKDGGLDWSRLLGPVAGVFMLAIVLFLTLGDEVARPQLVAGQDKVEHLVAFMALGLAFGWRASIRGLACYGLVLAGAAFAIETLQDSLTTTREGGLVDALAGCLGVVVGLSVAFAASSLSRRLMQAHSPRPSV